MMAAESGKGWENYGTRCVNEWLTRKESGYDTLMDLALPWGSNSCRVTTRQRGQKNEPDITRNTHIKEFKMRHMNCGHGRNGVGAFD